MLTRVWKLPRRGVRIIRRWLDSIAVERQSRRVEPRVATRDERRHPIHDDLEVLAYWIERPGEVGPAVSVFWGRQELLRIDLFDEGAHLHYGLAQIRIGPGGGGARIYLPADSIAGRAERARWELRHNLDWCLRTHPSRRVRRTPVADVDLAAAAEWLHDQVLDLDRTNR